MNEKLITTIQDILKPKKALVAEHYANYGEGLDASLFIHKKRGISKKQYPSLNFYKNRTYLISFN
jgi:hypothetical protein